MGRKAKRAGAKPDWLTIRIREEIDKTHYPARGFVVVGAEKFQLPFEQIHKLTNAERRAIACTVFAAQRAGRLPLNLNWPWPDANRRCNAAIIIFVCNLISEAGNRYAAMRDHLQGRGARREVAKEARRLSHAVQTIASGLQELRSCYGAFGEGLSPRLAASLAEGHPAVGKWMPAREDLMGCPGLAWPPLAWLISRRHFPPAGNVYSLPRHPPFADLFDWMMASRLLIEPALYDFAQPGPDQASALDRWLDDMAVVWEFFLAGRDPKFVPTHDPFRNGGRGGVYWRFLEASLAAIPPDCRPDAENVESAFERYRERFSRVRGIFKEMKDYKQIDYQLKRSRRWRSRKRIAKMRGRGRIIVRNQDARRGDIPFD